MDNNDGDWKFEWDDWSVEETCQVLLKEKAVWADEHGRWWRMNSDGHHFERVTGERDEGSELGEGADGGGRPLGLGVHFKFPGNGLKNRESVVVCEGLLNKMERRC